MSLDLDTVLSILRDHKIDGDNLIPIAKDLIAAEKEAKASDAAEKTPKAKSKMVVLIRGDASLKRLVDGGAWVVAIPEMDSSSTLLAKVEASVKQSNDSLKRGRASRVIRTFARAMEWLKPKVTKEHGIVGIRTKQAVEVVVVESEAI